MDSEALQENELVAVWFDDLRENKKIYMEPILNEFVVDKIKLLCDCLNIDSHVFITSVEVLNSYVTKKQRNNGVIKNSFLTLITSIHLAEKIATVGGESKMDRYINLYETVCPEKITFEDIKGMEIEILGALENHLPLFTDIDDLTTLLEHFITPLQLNFKLNNLCEEILIFVTINKLRLFAKIKVRYMSNMNALKVYKSLCINHLYIPIGVLICAFHLNDSLCHVISAGDLIKKMSNLCAIHMDHLMFLGNKIYELYQIKTNNII